MASVPGYGTNTLFVFERPRGNNWTASTIEVNETGVFRVDAYQAPLNSFCGAPVVQRNGNVMLVGGAWDATVPSGLRGMLEFDARRRTFRNHRQMHFARWYPTTVRMTNGKVAILGGSQEASNECVWNTTANATGFARTPSWLTQWGRSCIPTDSEEFTEANIVNNTSVSTQRFVNPPNFNPIMGPGWYPFATTLPFGDILVIGWNGGAIYTNTWQLLMMLPPMPAGVNWRVMYPFTAAGTMLPYNWEDGFTPRAMLYGGQVDAPSTNRTTPAVSRALRLDLPSCSSGRYCPQWSVEDMGGEPRVMADAVPTPAGRVMLIGGARAGLAGFHQSAWPQLLTQQYDHRAPDSARFRSVATSNIPRLYHTTACMELNGNIVVAGCDDCLWYPGREWANVSALPDPGIRPTPQAAFYEMRMELLTPPEINGVPRPVITWHHNNISRTAREIHVGYAANAAGIITGGTLVAPCATTHSVSMGGHVVSLQMWWRTADGVGFRLPWDRPGLLITGWYMLFLNAENGAYSTGRWIFVQ